MGRRVNRVLFVDFADPRKGEIALVVELDADNLVAALNLPKKDLRKIVWTCVFDIYNLE